MSDAGSGDVLRGNGSHRVRFVAVFGDLTRGPLTTASPLPSVILDGELVMYHPLLDKEVSYGGELWLGESEPHRRPLRSPNHER